MTMFTGDRWVRVEVCRESLVCSVGLACMNVALGASTGVTRLGRLAMPQFDTAFPPEKKNWSLPLCVVTGWVGLTDPFTLSG